MDIKKYIDNHRGIIGIKIGEELYIKNATNTGYLIAKVYDGIDLSYMGLNTRRGRVQGGMTQTLTCNGTLGVVVYDER